MKQTSIISSIDVLKENQFVKAESSIHKFLPRPCAECEAILDFAKESMMVCDSCQQDIGRGDGYKCSAGCQFAVCMKCGECNNRHLMARTEGKPDKFGSLPVICNRCNRQELEKDSVWWYCEDCNYAVCEKCVPSND